MLPYVSKSLLWLDNYSPAGAGVATTSADPRPCAEVTADLIPTVLALGRQDKALEWGRFLVRDQLDDGGFRSAAGEVLSPFGTARIVRGLNALLRLAPEFESPLVRAADRLIAGAAGEALALVCLPALAEAGQLLGDARYTAFASTSRDWHIKHLSTTGVTDFHTLNAPSHLFCAIQDALFELDAAELAAEGMQTLARFQNDSGCVPAYSDVRWVCAPGQFQAALLWFKLGQRERAGRALDFMLGCQNASGGFYGSYGVGADYFSDVEIASPIKFMFDAVALRDGGPAAAPVIAPAAAPVPAGKTLEANLAPDEWHESITRGTTPANVANAVRQGRAPQWVLPIMSETVAGDSVLELGSGTGELSAHLALSGRAVSLFDFSQGTLDFAAQVYGQLGIASRFTQGDVLKCLPFADRAIDVIWSSGLLEHFTDDEIAHIVTESARVANKRVISLVPNAASLAYRIGKDAQERSGRWIWGKEDPKSTLEPVFRAAGLHRIREYSIAPEHALSFMDAPELAALRAEMGKAYAALPPEVLQAFNQGYLLVTIGEVDPVGAPHTAAAPLPAGERYDNRVGMQLISQLLQKAGTAFDVLDIGCGNAQMLRKLRADGHRVRGIDASAALVAAHADVPLQQGLAEALPLADACADIVLSQDALDQVDDPALSLLESARVLRPDGLFFCQVGAGANAARDDGGQVRHFDGDSLRHAVQEAGLQVLTIWLIPHLAGDADNTLFLVAKKPGGGGTATVLAPVFAALGV